MAVRVVTGSGKALQSYDQWKESKTSSEPKQVVTSSGKSLQTYDEWKNKKNEESFASIDDDYFSSFLRDSQEFLKQNRQNAFQMTYASSRNRDDQSKMMEQWKSLSDQAKNIRDFLKRNQNSEGWNEDLKDLLDYTESFDGESWDIYSGYEQNYRYYDQFKSENDYNWHEKYKETGSDDLLKAMEGLEDGDEKTWLKGYANEVYNRELPEVDVEASRSKAASMQQLLDAYRQNKRFSTDARGQEWLKEVQPMLDQYGGEEGLEQAISRENQRANLAERVQELLKKQGKFESVTKNADFAVKSAFDPENTEIGYRYVNGDDWERFLLEQQNGQYVEEFGYHAFDSLTDEEKAVYNYYMNTGDRQSAAEYLDYLQETLNQRKGTATAEAFKELANSDHKILWDLVELPSWERYAYGAVAGLDQYRSSIEGLGNMIRGESGYVAPSATQYASGLIRENLAETGPKLPEFLSGTSVGQAAYDAVTTSANMAPSILASTVIGMVNPAVGAVVGQGMMGAGAAGSAYQEMVNAGYSTDQARLYGAAVGAAEIAMEKLLGGVSKLGGGAIKQITKWASNVDGALANVAIRLAGAAGSEGLEEGLQEIVSGWLKSEITKENFYAQPADVIYSSLLGAVTGGLFEGSDIIGDTAVQSKQGREVLKADGVEKLKALGLDAADADVRERAGKITDKTKAFGVGGLYRQVEADVRAKNASDITKSLTEKGMPEKAAKEYGKMLSDMLEFGSATDIQRTVMESDPIIGQTLREIQNTSSGVYQRTHGMNTARGRELSLDRVAALYGKQAEAVKANYIEGQSVEEYNLGTKKAFFIGRAGNKDALTAENVPFLTESQREIAYKLGRESVAAEKAAASKRMTGSDSAVQILNEDGSVGENVRIAGIASMDSKAVTYRLEDGRTVSEDQLSFSGDNAVLDTVKELGLDVDTANIVIHGNNTISRTDTQIAHGIEDAFRYGSYGYSQERLATDSPYAAMLTEEMRTAVYNAGKNAPQKAQKKPPAVKAKARGKMPGIYYDNGGGSVTAYSPKTFGKLEGKRRAGVQAATMFQKLGIGGDFYFYESYKNAKGERVYRDENGVERKAPNGWYDPNDGSIHIDLNAGNDGQGTTLFTMAHELTHYIEQWSPEKYKVLADFLIRNYEQGRSMDELVRIKQVALGDGRGKTVSYEEAYSEVIADSMEAMLADGNVMDKLLELKAQDRSLFRKMKEFFDRMLQKITGYYEGLVPESEEGQAVLAMKDQITEIQQLFAEALADAGENYRAAEVPPKNTQEGKQFSDRIEGKKRIAMSMTDSERTEILKDKVIIAAVYTGQADNSIASKSDSLNSHRENLVKAALVKISEEFKVFTDYNIADVDVDFRLSRGNLKESVSKKIDPVQIAKLLPVLKTAVENAIGIECHANRYFYDNNTVMFENLISGYVDGEFFVPVRFGLRHSVDGKATLYLIVDQKKIDVKKIKAEVAKATEMQNANAYTSRSAFNISLASITPFVNSKDILRYFPDDMLTDSQKKAKWEAIAETIVYTNNKNDSHYAEFIRNGNIVAAKRMVQQAAKVAGYTRIFFHGAKKGGGFTRFREWSYFTENKQYAERYAQRDNPGSLYTVYGKIEKPFDTRDSEAKAIFEGIRNEYGLSELQDTGLPDWTDGYDITDYIDENNLDYDGVILDEGGDLVDGKPVSRGFSYVIRNAEQIKSADVITYDDDGNIIPISKRFDTTNKDIRYQDRSSAPVTNRTLLANALESTAQHELEVEKIREYKAKISYLEEQEAKLAELRSQIRELSFAKGPRDTKKLRELRDEATKTANRINIYDKQLLRLESTAALQKVMKREQARIRKETQRNNQETLERYRQEVQAAYDGKLSDTQIMEKEFLRLMKAYEKQISSAKVKADKQQSVIDSYKADMKIMEKEFLRVMRGYETQQKESNVAWEREFNRLLREYDAVGRNVQRLEEKVRHQREAARANVDGRRRTVLRNKIRKDIKELDKILNRGNKQRNVKQGMQDMVSKAIASGEVLFIDSVTDEDLIINGIQCDMTEEERSLVDEAARRIRMIREMSSSDSMADVLEARRKGLRAIMSRLAPVLNRERVRINHTPTKEAFDALIESYKSLKDSEDQYISMAFSADVMEYLENLKKTSLDTLVKDMSQEQLQALHNGYKMVMTTIRNANKAFVDGRSIQAEAEKMVQEFQSRKIPQKAVGVVLKNLSDAVGWNYEKLYYALDRINSPTLSRLFGALADSENITMRDVQEAKAFQEEMVEKYHYNDWKIDQKIDRDFLDNTGKPFHLTLGELLALYAYSRRDGADTHIEVGGFTFGKTALTNPKPADTYKLTADQLEAVTGMLTPEQKAFAEAMQKYLSETMGGKGNEVSMKLYGIEMFGEENYFPLHIAGEYKARAQESQDKAEAGFQTMSNAGFTKARNKNATAPIVLEDFMTVWADHVNEMSRYHGAVPALEDIRRVMNYSVYSEAENNSVSVKAAMTNAYGKKAVEYFDELYREANSGAITDKMDAVPKKLLSLFRKNAVAYSLSVVIQQPASIYRARALVDRKYFGRHGLFTLTGGVLRILNRKKWNAAYAEMMKYAPGVTMAKEIGGFDTSTGGSIRSYLLDTDKSFRQSMKTGTGMQKAGAILEVVDDNVIANLPNVADKIAWIEMWEACKRETVAKNRSLSTGSEAFLQKVGERFTEVIRATQVYDSMFSKSPMLKSKNLFVQSMVSFMNEPNTVANMAEAAVRDLSRGNLKQAGKAAAALVTSIAVTNILKSLVYAMRDDDEDETFQEKYVSTIVGNLISDVNPLNYIPVARDAWSAWQGYDVERSDMAIVSDALNAIRQLKEIAGEDLTGMTEEALEEWDKKVTEASWAVAENLSPLFGIPLKNIRRDIMAIVNTAKGDRETGTRRGMQYAIEEGRTGKKKTDKQQLYEARVAGDAEHEARVEARYDDEKSANAAVKSAIREAFMGRDIDMATASKYLVQHAGVDAAEAHWTMDKWEYAREHGSEDGYGKYDKFFRAVEEGADLEPIIKEYTDYGITKSTLSGQVTEHFRQKYLEMSDSERSAFRDQLEDAYVACGKDPEEAEKKIDDWDFEAANGFDWSDRKKAYLSGAVSGEDLQKLLVSEGGYTEEDAAWQIEAYEWDRQGIEGATTAAVRNFHEFCEAAGVSPADYMKIRSFSNNTENDVDENGDKIAYSAMKKVMAQIHELNISSQQKTAIARSMGWKEKNIQKYKLWD